MGHAMRADTGTQSPDRIVVTLGGRAVATTNPDPMMVNTLQFSQLRDGEKGFAASRDQTQPSPDLLSAMPSTT